MLVSRTSIPPASTQCAGPKDLSRAQALAGVREFAVLQSPAGDEPLL